MKISSLSSLPAGFAAYRNDEFYERSITT